MPQCGRPAFRRGRACRPGLPLRYLADAAPGNSGALPKAPARRDFDACVAAETHECGKAREALTPRRESLTVTVQIEAEHAPASVTPWPLWWSRRFVEQRRGPCPLRPETAGPAATGR